MNSKPGFWELNVRKPAKKNLRRPPRHERERLVKVLEEMQENPFMGDIVRLTNQPTAFRRRVGDWRMFFDVNFGYRIVATLSVVPPPPIGN